MKSSTEIPNTKHAGRARHSVRAVSRPPDDGAQVTRPTLQDALPYRLGVGCFPLLAQCAINWHTIDGGGGTSTSGVFSVSGTIGQPDASGPLTNGLYSVTGGFWALPTAIQVTGAPTLTIVPAPPGKATISWTPNTPGFVLQQTSLLSPANWTNSPSGTTNPVVVPSSPAGFYRLFKP